MADDLPVLSFDFAPSEIAPLPSDAMNRLSQEECSVYDMTPAWVWRKVEMLWVTGQVTNVRHLKKTLERLHRIDLSENLLKVYLETNRRKIMQAENAFQEHIEMVEREDLLHLAMTGAAGGYLRMFNNLRASLGEITDDIMMKGSKDVPLKDLRGVTDSLVVLMKSDPRVVYRDRKQRDNREIIKAKQMDEGRAKTLADWYGKVLDERKKREDREREMDKANPDDLEAAYEMMDHGMLGGMGIRNSQDIVDDLMKQTDRIVDEGERDE